MSRSGIHRNESVGLAGVPGRYWHTLDDGRVQCDLCPRFCRLHDGQRGLCFVRGNSGGQIMLTTYGRSSGFCIDPVEKKPLYHFLPGTPVLSFGTAGCNLACKFCQNWDISNSRNFDRLQEAATPEAIAEAAVRNGSRSVAFTYNDPVIFHEYAVDTAIACRAQGVRTIAVSAGYVTAEPREEFFRHMDAVNIDLKAFNDRFYRSLCGGRLEPVLLTLEYIARETAAWLEITNLVIPGENDSDDEIERMTQWITHHLGSDVPLHFSAFFPAWKMSGHPATPRSTLHRARGVALRNGLRYVYTGNVPDPDGSATYCPACGGVVIARDGYELGQWKLSPREAGAACGHCGDVVAGVFESRPGNWGSRRQPIFI
ncbi:MAG: AmmeMemoRadiSam system radical SAM enzyme [Xanthomonadales bacterium]|nr:AmmeMemoRadiSam system radical SAM enzyme [Xanthomonadales bacterium]